MYQVFSCGPLAGYCLQIERAGEPFQDKVRQDVQVIGRLHVRGRSGAIPEGVLIFEISNPSAPVMVTKYINAGVSADMEYLQVGNDVGCFATVRAAVHIVDLSTLFSRSCSRA